MQILPFLLAFNDDEEPGILQHVSAHDRLTITIHASTPAISHAADDPYLQTLGLRSILVLVACEANGILSASSSRRM
jgi:hypothetical protein